MHAWPVAVPPTSWDCTCWLSWFRSTPVQYPSRFVETRGCAKCAPGSTFARQWPHRCLLSEAGHLSSNQSCCQQAIVKAFPAFGCWLPKRPLQGPLNLKD